MYLYRIQKTSFFFLPSCIIVLYTVFKIQIKKIKIKKKKKKKKIIYIY